MTTTWYARHDLQGVLIDHNYLIGSRGSRINTMKIRNNENSVYVANTWNSRDYFIVFCVKYHNAAVPQM